MAAVLVLALAVTYFGRRWRVDTYRAWKQAQRTDFGSPCVTTRRPR